MTEYWVSKKQYWCKYCDIWIRDDAPSKRLHESGLKHQGNKERYIRDLYKGGERAKRDKESEKLDMARIEAAAQSAYAKDKGLTPTREDGRPVAPASSSRPRPKASGDKFSNYSSAGQLGFNDQDTKLSSYEIEQMVRGRSGNVGAWEEVQQVNGDSTAGKRKAEAVEDIDDDDDPNNFKFSHRDKRPVSDPYDDDDWDPKAALGGLKLRQKETPIASSSGPALIVGSLDAGLNREGWSGKLKLEREEEAKGKSSQVAKETETVKSTAPEGAKFKPLEKAETAKVEPVNVEPTSVEQPPAQEQQASPAVPAPPAPTSVFKKRRPPPSSRKK